MKFFTGKENTIRITKLLKSSNNLKCAVAFWGSDASKWLKNTDQEIEIICNLESGVTDPYEIEKLLLQPNIKIKTQSRLHAKVYWTNEIAIVGSSNVSDNGLPQNNSTGNIEASIEIISHELLKEIEEWFKKQWEHAKNINNKLLEDQKIKWRENPKREIPILDEIPIFPSHYHPNYRKNKNKLKNDFPAGYNFLDQLEKSDYIQIGSYDNLHVYNHPYYLLRIEFLSEPIGLSFRKNFHGSIKKTAKDYSNNIFSGRIQEIISQHNGYNQRWASNINEGEIKVYAQAPEVFFNDMISLLINP